MDPSKMGGMLQAAQKMQEEMADQLGRVTVEGTAGGGAVAVKMNGRKEVLAVKLDPATVSALGSSTADREMLEDLLTAAFNDAGRKADGAAQSGASSLLSGLGLPPGLF
jgi:nucleoid-associated protein EbfC